MPTRDPPKAVQMLDLLRQFFGEGRYWLQHAFSDDAGSACLVDAMSRLRRRHHLYGDTARYYLTAAMPRLQCQRMSLVEFNDRCCDYARLENLIGEARILAMRDLREAQQQRIAPPNPVAPPVCRAA
jgi:hypothetical protein